MVYGLIKLFISNQRSRENFNDLNSVLGSVLIKDVVGIVVLYLGKNEDKLRKFYGGEQGLREFLKTCNFHNIFWKDVEEAEWRVGNEYEKIRALVLILEIYRDNRPLKSVDYFQGEFPSLAFKSARVSVDDLKINFF